MIGLLDKTMLLAILGIILIAVIFILLETYGGPEFASDMEFSIVNLVLSNFLGFVETVVAVYSIRLIRGNEKVISKDPEIRKRIGVYGYIWRTLFIFTISLFIASALTMIFQLQVEVPSVLFSLIMFPIICILIVILTWLFFSYDRKGQLVRCAMYFNGY